MRIHQLAAAQPGQRQPLHEFSIMTKEQRLMQIYQAQRETAHNQTALLAAEFDEMKLQRDGALNRVAVLEKELAELKTDEHKHNPAPTEGNAPFNNVVDINSA